MKKHRLSPMLAALLLAATVAHAADTAPAAPAAADPLAGARALIAEKRRAYDEQQAGSKKNAEITPPTDRSTAEGRDEEVIEVTGEGVSFPPSATMCHKCSTKALVIMDGCATCLNCGYSKCG